MSKRKLYLYISAACLAGYIWILISSVAGGPSGSTFTTCLIKHVTDIPCPSCGSTRAVLSFFNGDIITSLQWNPLGIVLASILLAAPLLIAYDLLKGTQYLFNLYSLIESNFKQKRFFIPAGLLLICNWIWNISKGL